MTVVFKILRVLNDFSLGLMVLWMEESIISPASAYIEHSLGEFHLFQSSPMSVELNKNVCLCHMSAEIKQQQHHIVKSSLHARRTFFSIFRAIPMIFAVYSM